MNTRTHIKRFSMSVLLFIACLCQLAASETNPAAITALLNRIGGQGTADRFVTIVDNSLTSAGKDVFVITAESGKPCIKGNTALSVATGINWYLNHYAHINLAWNQLTTDLTSVSLPVPAQAEQHTASVNYRYYLNYCTFSYSMSTWTWERWQQEIDWMALHGINLPLQIVGLDVVWMKLLTEDLGYTRAEANKFIAGPCFQAWWGMNNLQGWGGANPDWWYTRQEKLAKQILARQRELGMSPVLPGYAGMVPSDITTKGYTANNQGNWCAFVRPYILDPNSTAFADISAKYYKRLEEVMGTSDYYSMDPFHEGANTEGIDVASAYSKIAQAMTNANAAGKWVIQFWQWSGDQYNVLSKVSKGKLIVLDLFSDAHTHFGDYQGHDAVYCMLPNFGGRTGLFGRLTKVMTDFYKQKSTYSNIKGIGATPEAIEQVPVLYDALFELPWRATQPDPQQWLADYTESRYGANNADAQFAWEQIRQSALNCETALQGPQEAVLCARPALQVGSVSSWGGTDIFYDAQQVADAAFRLLAARNTLSGANYSYDLTDFARQALTDYGYYLLRAIKQAIDANDPTAYAQRRDAYLDLMLDLDRLLCTNSNFMLGRWTTMARNIANEADGTTEADRQWLELNNARTLITTWGDRQPSESGGLRDYSYREWGGMMKDFYYDRWKTFFSNYDNGKSQPDWFNHDWQWAHNANLQYTDQPTGNTADVADELLQKYFVNFQVDADHTYHIYRYTDTDARKAVNTTAYRGTTYAFPLSQFPASITATVAIDFNNDNQFTADESATGLSIAIPSTAVTGPVNAQITLSDGTTFRFRVTLKDRIDAPRTVSVATASAAEGTAAIQGTTATSVTNTEEVTIQATPVSGYDFLNWTDANQNVVSTDNPYTYYGATDATFTANFMLNRWGSVREDLSELSTISGYGQYLSTITVQQNSGEESLIYRADACPETLCHNTQSVQAPAGSRFLLHWTDKGGMNYCRLSAYIDLNADGDFDDEGELLAVVGDKASAGNNQLHDYTLPILLPYDVPEGITHVRLRFDSSWMGGLSAQTDAMLAKADTKRMVYDVPVNITRQSTTACTVTVRTANATQGTVDANGQPDTYTYAPSEEVVLRCYPADGYALHHWSDAYGRTVPTEWTDGHFLRFRAPESGTYTAHFSRALPAQLTLDDWTFDYEQQNDQITLTQVVSGQGALTIPEAYQGVPIVALAPELLRGQTALTSLTLPKGLTDLGNTNLFTTSQQGTDAQQAIIHLPQTLRSAHDWLLKVNVTTDGHSFNQWGSGLLATGTDALANAYDQGFQLYLKADGNLILKMGDAEKKTFALTAGASAFQITIAHSASQKFTLTVSANGSSDSYTATVSPLADITTLAAAIPAGINLTEIKATDAYPLQAPFRGCTALATLKVTSGNPAYKAVANVLYSNDGTRLIAYPEGRISHRLSLPTTVQVIGQHAFTSAPQLERIVTSRTTPATLEEQAFETATKGIYVEMPLTAAQAYRSAWQLPLVFAVGATSTLDDTYCAQVTDNDVVDFACKATSTAQATTVNDGQPVWLTGQWLADRFYPIYFPTQPEQVSVEGLTFSEANLSQLQLWTFADNAFSPTSLGTGAFLMRIPEAWSGRTVTFRFPSLAAAPSPLTAFTGNGTATNIEAVGAYTYDVTTNVFSNNVEAPTSTTLPPFSAALIATADSPTSINGPTPTGIVQLTTNTSDTTTLYDVSGRRAVPNGHRAVRIRPDGYKFISK